MSNLSKKHNEVSQLKPPFGGPIRPALGRTKTGLNSESQVHGKKLFDIQNRWSYLQPVLILNGLNFTVCICSTATTKTCCVQCKSELFFLLKSKAN